MLQFEEERTLDGTPVEIVTVRCDNCGLGDVMMASTMHDNGWTHDHDEGLTLCPSCSPQ